MCRKDRESGDAAPTFLLMCFMKTYFREWEKKCKSLCISLHFPHISISQERPQIDVLKKDQIRSRYLCALFVPSILRIEDVSVIQEVLDI